MEIQKRFFTQNNIREALRDLNIGIDNLALQRYVADGTFPQPEIDEFTVKLWSYKSTVKLIEKVYEYKKEDWSMSDINTVLIEIKKRNKR